MLVSSDASVRCYKALLTPELRRPVDEVRKEQWRALDAEGRKAINLDSVVRTSGRI